MALFLSSPKWAKADFRVTLKCFEINKSFMCSNLFRYYTKQIDSMLPCVCSIMDHRRHQNVVRTSVTHSAVPRVPLFCSYHILTLSVIYCWTDTRQNGIYYLLNRNTPESLGELEKAVEHSPVAHVPTAFLVLPNFHLCFYWTIRLWAQVFYEQIVNEVQPS